MPNKRRMIRQVVQSVLDKHEILDGTLADEIADSVLMLVPQRITSQRDERSSSPEIQAFRQVTGFYPARPAYGEIITLASGKSIEQMQEAYQAWCVKGNNPRSAIWLKWIRDGSSSPKEVIIS